MQDGKMKKKIINDILANYHYARWGYITGSRDWNTIPQYVQRLFYRIGQLVITQALSHEEERKQVKELKQIRKQLKKYFKNLEHQI